MSRQTDTLCGGTLVLFLSVEGCPSQKMSRQAMPVSEKSGGVQSYSTVQARKIDHQREPAILRITRLENYRRFSIWKQTAAMLSHTRKDASVTGYLYLL
jgi:hypothetical protein